MVDLTVKVCSAFYECPFRVLSLSKSKMRGSKSRFLLPGLYSYYDETVPSLHFAERHASGFFRFDELRKLPSFRRRAIARNRLCINRRPFGTVKGIRLAKTESHALESAVHQQGKEFLCQRIDARFASMQYLYQARDEFRIFCCSLFVLSLL